MEKDFEQLLREKIETFFNMHLLIRGDFDTLSTMVYERTGKTICATTLRRFWGYQELKPSRRTTTHTLNLLSRLVGAKDWKDFQNIYQEEKDGGKASSSFIREDDILDVATLRLGTHVVLTWAPNRRVEIAYKGHDEFCVVASEGSKLNPGDTFLCHQIVKHHPLYCTNLTRGGVVCGDYCCGEQGGVNFIKA